jgi:hypothetical protein
MMQCLHFLPCLLYSTFATIVGTYTIYKNTDKFEREGNAPLSIIYALIPSLAFLSPRLDLFIVSFLAILLVFSVPSQLGLSYFSDIKSFQTM